MNLESGIKTVYTMGIGYYDATYVPYIDGNCIRYNPNTKTAQFVAGVRLMDIPSGTNIFSNPIPPVIGTYLIGVNSTGGAVVLYSDKDGYVRTIGDVTAASYYFDCTYFTN